jgi:transcriptional regulator with XRE-family HTH domain
MHSVDPQKLKAARGTRRKEAVALEVHRSFSTITAYEAGIIAPSVETLLALADCYGVTVEELCSPAVEAVEA